MRIRRGVTGPLWNLRLPEESRKIHIEMFNYRIKRCLHANPIHKRIISFPPKLRDEMTFQWRTLQQNHLAGELAKVLLRRRKKSRKRDSSRCQYP